MKIAFIINSLKSKSGSERVAIELANKLSAIKIYDVSIINRESSRLNCAYPLAPDVNVITLKGNIFSFISQLSQSFIKENYDVVIIHNMGKLSLLVSLLPKVKKLVSLEHVSFVSRPKIIQNLSKFLYKKIDQIICLTNNDKKQFSEFHSNVLTIPNFSPFTIVSSPRNRNKKIVTIGRLTDQKNYIHLLQAWKKIYQSIPDWQLNIYGDGEYKKLLHDYIEQNSLKNVSLKGTTSNVKQVYEQSSFFVMCSKYEGLPMVLIEAQSFGLPIVSYDCPYGPSDIIQDHKNGLLVSNQNVNELAAAILKLTLFPDLLDEFAKNSLLSAQKYQPEQILKIWIEKVL
ncbi:glycosyltransferase family 4 protein [Acinetobacter sp. BSP-28]|uniref:glycosyltransferase family 4 protein n=1 Tax=Acinetobacter sp. BSP-28 TaxID=3344661 RepID=UPI00376F8EF7